MTSARSHISITAVVGSSGAYLWVLPPAVASPLLPWPTVRPPPTRGLAIYARSSQYRKGVGPHTHNFYARFIRRFENVANDPSSPDSIIVPQSSVAQT